MTVSLDVAIERGAFSLRVSAELGGGTTGVYGPNGSGKSTLLAAIAGTLPSTGRIAVGGRVLQDTERGVWLPPEARGAGMVFQDLRLFPHLSVRDNLAYGARTPIDSWVDLLELAALLERRPSALSGGERQRVALGRALATRPCVLLLDEALSALDTARRAALLPVLARATRQAGVPVLVVSHQLGDVLQLTDTLLVLDEGRVLGHGPAQDLLAVPEVLAVARGLGLDNLLEVRELQQTNGLPTGRVGRNRLMLPPGAPDADRGYVSLRPEEVLLAVGPVGRTSARNLLPGVVARLMSVDGRVVVTVDIGVPLAVEVTQSAVADLELRPGVEVTCLVKTTALRWVG